MRKLVQSTYDGDPRFARGRVRPLQRAAPAPPQRVFRYVEPDAEDERAWRGGERSGLASAAGFAGLIFLFRCSFDAFVFNTTSLPAAAAALLVLAWSLSAPAAVALGLAAARELDRSPGMEGKLRALAGFTVGVVGVVKLFAEVDYWLAKLIW
ncbi:MAG TPA: hypothetical protein VE360_13880 [Pyrinomonadaceae bacterium]|nr:hypothetical protein [Pyrinomonadaceae bacterium]